MDLKIKIPKNNLKLQGLQTLNSLSNTTNLIKYRYHKLNKSKKNHNLNSLFQ